MKINKKTRIAILLLSTTILGCSYSINPFGPDIQLYQGPELVSPPDSAVLNLKNVDTLFLEVKLTLAFSWPVTCNIYLSSDETFRTGSIDFSTVKKTQNKFGFGYYTREFTKGTRYYWYAEFFNYRTLRYGPSSSLRSFLVTDVP